MDNGSLLDTLFGPGPILAVQQFFGPGWGWLFGNVARIAAPAGLATVVALALWLSGRPLAYRLLGILVLSAGVCVLLWNVVGLDRPHDPRIAIRAHPPVSSFPSGHVVQTTALWGVLAAAGVVPVAIVATVVAGVALSRLYLGVHYLGDVLGGALIGLLLLVAYCRIVAPQAERWLLGRSFAARVELGVIAMIGVLVAAPLLADPSERLVQGTLGALLGGTVAVLVEAHYLRSYPVPVRLRCQALKLLIGFGGAAALLLPLFLVGSLGPIPFAADVALATAWVLFGAPAAFCYLGLARRAEDRAPAGGDRR